MVKVPSDAKLKIQGDLTKKTGPDRGFVSPPLEPGKSYEYTLEATFEPNNYTTITRTRTMPVKAGATAEADLRKADDRQPDDIFVRYVAAPGFVV